MFKDNTLMTKNIRVHCYYTGKYRGVAHSVCNLKNSIPKECPAVLHNGWSSYYCFIIKELAKEFEGEFNCLGKNTRKHKIFSVPRTNEV